MLRFVAVLHDAKPVGRGLQVKELLRASQELPRRPWGATNHASRPCAAEKCHACASNPPPELEDGRDLPGFDGRLHGPEQLGQGLRQLLDPVSNGGVVVGLACSPWVLRLRSGCFCCSGMTALCWRAKVSWR